MAATMHVMVTKGVRFPGYSLLPPPMGIPPPAIFSDLSSKKKRECREEEKVDGGFGWGVACVYIEGRAKTLAMINI